MFLILIRLNLVSGHRFPTRPLDWLSSWGRRVRRNEEEWEGAPCSWRYAGINSYIFCLDFPFKCPQNLFLSAAHWCSLNSRGLTLEVCTHQDTSSQALRLKDAFSKCICRTKADLKELTGFVVVFSTCQVAHFIFMLFQSQKKDLNPGEL